VPAGGRIGEVVREWLVDVPGLHRRLAALPSPYGDGTAAERIAEAVRTGLGQVAPASSWSADGPGGHWSPHMALRAAR
jgi:UDP-N-acetylglucosamine 2-epimerase (non-hydrolysing)